MKNIFSCLLTLILLASILLTSCAKMDTNTATTEPATQSTHETSEKEQENDENKTTAEDPADDGIINVLLIGNSFCTYFPDELASLAENAGIDMKVYSVYYSGCKLSQHYDWFRGDIQNYTLYRCHGTKAREAVGSNISLKTCLQQENWDVISLQQHFRTGTAMSYESSLSTCNPYAQLLYKMLKTNFPMAKLYWHETWSYQIGYGRDDGPIDTVEKQTTMYETIKKVSERIVEVNKVTLTPCGDAWQLARNHPDVGDVLCKNPAKNGGKGDYYHDGDTGGGQFLNACVWFEMITQKSCLDNPFTPSYELSDAKIAALKECAHKAVAARYGEDFAK
jgi:hypothetical protein